MPTYLQFQLLEELLREKGTQNKLDEEDILKSLHFIFHDNVRSIELALDIVDKGNITMITSASCDRSFWRVSSSHMSEEYIVLKHHCACRSYSEQFRFAVTATHDQNQDKASPVPVLCKHLLAVKIAILLDRVSNPIVVSDAIFVDMMCNANAASVQGNYGPRNGDGQQQGYQGQQQQGYGSGNTSSSYGGGIHDGGYQHQQEQYQQLQRYQHPPQYSSHAPGFNQPSY